MIRILLYGLCEKFGGTEQYVMTTYRAMDRSKIQFDFLFDYKTGEIPYEDEIIRMGGKVYRAYYKYRDRKVPGAITIKRLFKEHPEWNGVYLNCQGIDTSYRLMIEAKKAGLGIRAIHAHNNRLPHKACWKDHLIKFIFDLTKNRYVTNFLACSELAGRSMFHNTKFTVIPNGVNFDKYLFDKMIRNKMRKQYHINEKTMVVGFCGRLAEQKRPQRALHIFQELHNIYPESLLFLVGDGPLREECENLAKKLDLKDQVIFTGAVTNVSDFMQLFDCFLLPSRNEGFGIVLLEAQAAGLNCFTTRSVVPKETNVTGHVYFMEDEFSDKKWAEEMLKIGFDRYDEIEKLRKSDYRVEVSANRLTNEFMRAGEKHEK